MGVGFMYIKPKIYRGFSIFVLVSGMLGFLSSVVSCAFYFNASNYKKILGIPVEVLPDETRQALFTYVGIIGVALIIVSAITVIFNYMDFSSMFQFADLIEHEERKDDRPVNKRPFVFSPKAYKNFGTVIFTINFVIFLFVIIGIIIAKSIANSVFVALPLIPIGFIALDLLVVYITYYMRYKAFGDVLEAAMEPDQKNPSVMVKENLKDNKTGVLRGWGTFLFVCCFLVTILTVTGIILTAVFLPKETHFILIFYIVVSWIISVISLSITSCFYDNLAMMLERKLIKYDLIRNANKSVKCKNCGATVSGDANFCSTCGTKP